MNELRYIPGFIEAPSDQPGLVQALDGTVMLVAPDGARSELGGSGQTALTSLFATPLAFSIHPVQTISGGNLVGGSSPTGRLGGFAALPLLPYAPGQLVDLLSGFAAVLSGTVASVSDPFTLSIDADVFVGNAAGSQLAHAVVTGTLAAPITDLAFTADFSADEIWAIDAGADLSAVGSVLSSTAGGTYQVWVGIQAAWDS